MAIDFGRAARGIATGYLSAKVADIHTPNIKKFNI